MPPVPSCTSAPSTPQCISHSHPSCLHAWQSGKWCYWQRSVVRSGSVALAAPTAKAKANRACCRPRARSAAVSAQHDQPPQVEDMCTLQDMSASSSSSAPSSEEQALRRRLAGSYPSTLLLPGARLPPLHTAHHVVNLTNGLEALPLLTRLGLPHSFCRLRSTAMEQQELEQFVGEVDAALLMAAALGHTIVVWDCGSRSGTHGAPRALWHGLALLRYVLVRSWWGEPPAPFVKGHDLSRDYEAVARSFSQRTSRRIKYYRQFVAPSKAPGVELYGAYRYTPHDGDVAHWVELAQQYAGLDTLSATGAMQRQVQGDTQVDAAAVAAAMLEEGFALMGPGLSHEELLNVKLQGICS